MLKNVWKKSSLCPTLTCHQKSEIILLMSPNKASSRGGYYSIYSHDEKKCHSTFNAWNDKKLIFDQDFLAWPSDGQKIPKAGLRPKNLPAAQKKIVLPHLDIFMHFNIEIYHNSSDNRPLNFFSLWLTMTKWQNIHPGLCHHARVHFVKVGTKILFHEDSPHGF